MTDVAICKAHADDAAYCSECLWCCIESLEAYIRKLEAPATMRAIRYAAIVRTVEKCEGNRTRAAKVLGISRQTLRTALKEGAGDE